jgi:hypothetical protein
VDVVNHLLEGTAEFVPSCVMQLAIFLATQGVRFLQAFAVAWVLVYLVDRLCRFNIPRRLRHDGDRWLGFVAVGCLSAAIASTMSWLRPPVPSVHDEFSYLLAGDTFSHGRLTNPTHPMWRHFETLHVIHQPTYASKYPPGQGLVLAMGQVAAGDPMVGLWLSAGLAAVAATWMLHAWMPRRWALLGGVLVALHPGIQLIWTQTYWGGNVALIGGALVLGAYVRLRNASRCRDAAWMALGLAILANSRPFEGAIASVPVAVAMLFRLIGPVRRVGVQALACLGRVVGRESQPEGCTPARNSPSEARAATPHTPFVCTANGQSLRALQSCAEGPRPLRDPPSRLCGSASLRAISSRAGLDRARSRLCVCLAFCAALTVAAAWMAWYNWRVAGNPLKMPYMVHEETYGAAPFFLWQSAGSIPEYRHAKIARLHSWLRDTYVYQRTWAGFVGEKWIALVNLWHFFLGVALSIPLLALPWVLRNRRYWLPVAVVTVGWAASLMTTWVNPHYFAPAAPAVLLLVVQGIRHLRIRSRRRTQGRSRLVRALILAQLIGFVPYTWFHVRQPAHEFASQRAELVSRLQASPGRHLVIVQYGSDYDIHQEWVHNGANLDTAKIVWARPMNPAADRQLVEYFRDRQVWLLRASQSPPRLVPYREATPPASGRRQPTGAPHALHL